MLKPFCNICGKDIDYTGNKIRNHPKFDDFKTLHFEQWSLNNYHICDECFDELCRTVDRLKK